MTCLSIIGSMELLLLLLRLILPHLLPNGELNTLLRYLGEGLSFSEFVGTIFSAFEGLTFLICGVLIALSFSNASSISSALFMTIAGELTLTSCDVDISNFDVAADSI
jgi:hypothetical protein